VTSGGNIDTKKDSMIKLNCEADGNPVPNITWTRKVILYYILIKLSVKYSIILLIITIRQHLLYGMSYWIQLTINTTIICIIKLLKVSTIVKTL